MRFPSPSPDATRTAARLLADAIDARGLLVALIGPLGAGKTLFVQALAEGLGVDPDRVSSPTFVIASEYTAPGGRLLAHVDLYRVANRDELDATGFTDLLVPGAVVAVEWADRIPDALSADRLEIRLERPEPADATRRALNAVALGPVAEAVLARWSGACAREFDLE